MKRAKIIAAVIAAILTLAIYSFLYRDNLFYRFAEHLLIGLSVGFTLVLLFNSVLMPKLFLPLFRQGDPLSLIPLLLLDYQKKGIEVESLGAGEIEGVRVSLYDLEGGETELDRQVLEQIKDPLIHLLRNAIDSLEQNLTGGSLFRYALLIVAVSLLSGIFLYLTRQTIIAIEQGRYSPSLEVAFKVARVFGVPMDEAFHYPDDAGGA